LDVRRIDELEVVIVIVVAAGSTTTIVSIPPIATGGLDFARGVDDDLAHPTAVLVA
jgi:hypothetical protein